MKYLKKYYHYYLCFLLFFFGILFLGYNNTDNIWNYGMAHAIRIGEIPYRDFNIITTPLYAYLMSFFLLFSDQYLFFVFGQSFLGVFAYSFVYQMIGKKVFYLIPAILLGFGYLFFPNYNFLVLVFLVLLLYLEKEEKSDYLIGFILGLLVLTKHTMGVVIILCSFLSTKSIKKCWHRILGMLGLGILFVVFLLVTGAFPSFWNLSVAGLFDFGGNNHYRSPFFLVLSLICFLYCIYRFIKYKGDVSNYYYLGSFFFLFPLVDLFHFQYLACMTLILILMNLKDKEIPKVVKSGVIVLFVFSILLNVCYHADVYSHSQFSQTNHFMGYLTTREYEEHFQEVLEDYESRENNWMFNYHNMFFDIASNHPISYMDIPLYGNFGYDGTNSMIKKVDDMHDVYFYVSDHENIQYAKEIYEHIKETSTYSYSVWIFDVYYKE
ncbi:MAG: hypothetical protein J6X28_04250 [Bacilli bacterium]|nr:hypothetical protein [Bacilli bacterium]